MTTEDYLNERKKQEHMLEAELQELMKPLDRGELRREEMYWTEGRIEDVEEELRTLSGLIDDCRRGNREEERMTDVTVQVETRLDRGKMLFEERGHEIIQKRDGSWRVPGSEGAVYTVKGGYCSCPDHAMREERCKHSFAVGFLKAKTDQCVGCLLRFRYADLYEVYGSLTYFDGDTLCEGCASNCDWEELV